MKKKLYISLPVTGKDIDDVRLRCGKAVEKYGRDWEVIVPTDIIKQPDTPYSVCMGKCIEALMECDTAVFLSGWADSKGCNLEFETCRIYGIKTFTDGRI